MDLFRDIVESTSYTAFPPGTSIREQLENRNMKQKELAERMGMTEKHLCQLLKGDAPLTIDIANKLECVLGISASIWLKLEAGFRETLNLIKQENEMEEDVEFSRKLPYAEMVRLQWIAKATKKFERVNLLRSFFEVARLKYAVTPNGLLCRRYAITEKSNMALLCFAQKAKRDARSIEVEDLDLKTLKKSLPEIRKMTREPLDVFTPKLQSLLASCGVALVFLPALKGSYLNGVAFFDEGKVTIGITSRGKFADKFWFSFFHELGHVLLHHVFYKNGITYKEECEANFFAQDNLIDRADYATFVAQENFSSSAVVDFANKQGINTGIVVARLQNDRYLKFDELNELRDKYADYEIDAG